VAAGVPPARSEPEQDLRKNPPIGVTPGSVVSWRPASARIEPEQDLR
jgi:hypothetical protein